LIISSQNQSRASAKFTAQTRVAELCHYGLNFSQLPQIRFMDHQAICGTTA